MHVVSLDVTDEDSVFQCMAKVKEFCQNKGLWAIINNAGIASFGDIEFTSMEKYRQVLEVNLLGSIQLTKLCLPYVRKAKGRVINMSGASGLLSAPGQSAFCISCFAVEAFSDALRIEMQPFGVKVITIRPGNYLGATGILNKSACGKVKTEFDQLKNSTDQEVLNAYGTKHLDTQLEQLSDLSKSTASSLVNVVTAMENAVTNLSSGSQYLVDGGSQLFDVSNILIKLRPFVPASWHDSLVSKNFRQGTTVQAVQ
ncbi:D-beta-hydroxybutyrate dehydrogenase, mitochondrial isoform X2 [Aplysia californica]|nr:D-beta-hydroxybutyrate dehydrogenase, mitochondrial isoform X2 [Aplysia californica]